MDLQSVA